MKRAVFQFAVLLLVASRLFAAPPANDDFANRTVLSPGTVGGTLVEATIETNEFNVGNGNPQRSVWYEFSVPDGQKWRLTFTSSAPLDARMLIGTGTAADNFGAQYSVFTTGGGAPGKIAYANTTGAAQTFLISISNDSDAVSTFTLDLAVDSLGPLNDNLAAATALPGAGTVAGDTTNASVEEGEFFAIGSNAVFASVWYSLTVPAGMRATATLTPSGFDSRLATYRGTTFASLILGEAAESPGIGSIEKARMDNRTGGDQTFVIQVDGADFSSGAFTLDIALSPVPPVNDDLQNPANAFPGATTNGTTVDATSESGEPAHAGSPAARSVWYYVLVDSLNKATVTVTPSGFDARIALYRGSTADFSSLVLVSSANVAGSGGAEVVQGGNFSVVSEVLLLAVDAVSGGSGTFTVNHQATSAALDNDNFSSAVALPTGLFSFLLAYNSTGATAETGEPQLNGGAPQSLWFKFTALEDGKLSVFLNSNTGPAPSFAVFTGASVNALTTVGAYAAGQSELSVQSLQTYFIAVSTPAGQPGSGSFNCSFRTLDPGQFSFQSDTASVNEGLAQVTLTVNRTSADGVVMIPFTITPGTATTADYADTSRVLQFDDGIFQLNIDIPIVDDALVEPDETFTVTLGTPTLGSLTSPSSATVTIPANDQGGGGGGGGGGNQHQFYVPNAGFTGLINSDFAQTGFGLVQFRIVGNDLVTGKLLVDGLSVPFRSQFVSTGTDASFTANLKARRGRTILNLTLTLTLENDTIHFTGTLSGLTPTAYALAGERNSVGTFILPIPHVGNYNALLSGNAIEPGGGGGAVRGITRIIVRPGGAAILVGTLPDGMRFVAVSQVSLLGNLHFAKGLYRAVLGKITGYIAGSLSFSLVTNPKSVSGMTHWNKPANNGRIYPLGVPAAVLALAGSRYTPPPRGQRALADFNANNGAATATLTEGNLAADIVKAVSISTNNKVTVAVPAGDRLRLAIIPSTGYFTGFFIHSDGRARGLIGLLVPSTSGLAEGLFVGTDKAGVIQITPQP